MASLTQRNLSKLWEIVQERGIMVHEVHEVWSMGSAKELGHEVWSMRPQRVGHDYD